MERGQEKLRNVPITVFGSESISRLIVVLSDLLCYIRRMA